MANTAFKRAWKHALAIAIGLTGFASAQTAAPRVSGTVKATTAQSLTVLNASGQEVAVAVSDTAKLLQVAPGSKDLKSATPVALVDILAGDKVIVTGTDGDAAGALHATRVIVMKSADIAQTHAAEEAAWQKGGGGLVKSVDPAGAIVVASGAKMLTIQTTPTTKLRRYSGDSIRFEDATPSQFSEIKAGDQVRVRGARSEDGTSIQADEIVTGAFRNFSGILASVDNTAGTVTLKDLATKKTITVKVTANSDIRHIPVEMATRFASRTAATATTAAPGTAPAGTTAPGTRSPGAGAASAGGPPSGAARPGAEGAGAGSAGAGQGGSARAGMDLSQMLSRLPKQAVTDLKTGDAVMIVATEPSSEGAQPTAVTVLAGVEPILQASPKGEMVLTPWGVGGGAPDAGGGGGQ